MYFSPIINYSRIIDQNIKYTANMSMLLSVLTYSDKTNRVKLCKFHMLPNEGCGIAVGLIVTGGGTLGSTLIIREA